MRFATTLLMWLVTTLLLAVALPAAWVQQHLVDEDGYAALAQRAAADPGLQSAMASELTSQVGRLGTGVNTGTVSLVAAAYTASSTFPGQFAQANRFAHRWLFTDRVRSSVDSQGRWVIDAAPMLSDAAFKETLSDYNVTLPSSIPIPLTDNAPAALRPGALRPVATFGPWVSVGAAVVAGMFALLTLFVARSRGKMLVGLGVSALLVGASGWAAIEFGRRRLDAVLNNSSGDIRRIAEVMIGTAQDSMHQWLNITLIVGGGLVIIGVIVSLLVSLAKTN
ncbi:hypothetical protein [Mycolicibacterium aichiense]|uniref:Transmembrane protein n=1 Tax=Mycolicibacterium aichiense TaxID=1799 RepID=A0AAD1MDZ6_9MYCO|nr:hypothetical protein [Mycolicibacterium aichiense]MCV7017439.1 hypothetical protein [Mycolicibacterium aichiense]BBX10128.1 hypothetical protein MAIC_49310 [Mycolicibacterium aichiense]STZ26205.1 Uncharacterised protein [Mycolicibacterium aichiense]